VPGIVNLALDQVLASLDDEDYEAQSFIIPACSVGAWHKRERVVILAHDMRKRDGFSWSSENAPQVRGEGIPDGGRVSGDDLRERWQDQSGMGGMVYGIPEGIHEPDSDTECKNVQGIFPETLSGGEFYRSNLEELLEPSPAGIVGRANPMWIEWLMGYPIGSTELDASETP
jgi:site-specific DNA-cytosine methylase